MTMLPSTQTKTIRVHSSNIRDLEGSPSTHSLQTGSDPARKSHSVVTDPSFPLTPLRPPTARPEALTEPPSS